MPNEPESPAPGHAPTPDAAKPAEPSTPASATPPAADSGVHPAAHSHGPLVALGLGALGVVYGDIGTSPLYALRECFSGHHGIAPTPENVLGVLSLVLWSLIVVVTIKYVGFVTRADNRGEGGTLSLMALAAGRGTASPRARKVLVGLGLFGTALLYGEGMLTPAISVLSAVEGLGTGGGGSGFVVPLTLAILVGLFLVQRTGTQKVGAVFGPVMMLWFAVLSTLGVASLSQTPSVLAAVNPAYALGFIRDHGWASTRTLGSVVLVITGGEALYADLGHFGRDAIKWAWLVVVLPALTLNYFGQGALLLRDPGAASDLFYRMAPAWGHWPLVALATAAAVIASQALISASFSLTRSAVQLGYCPRVQIVHTSSREIGQIYVPAVNWALMVACIGLVVGFRTSSNLAAAYGLAVTAVMTITSVLFLVVAHGMWKWSWARALPLVALFLVIDLTNFSSSALKFFEGGWFPLAIALGVFSLMTTWKWGRKQLGVRLKGLAMPLELFLDTVMQNPPTRVAGTAVFMAGNRDGVPPSLLHNLKHNKVLHERVVLLTLATEEVPTVPDRERLQVEELAPGLWRIVAHYGFMEGPNVPELLELAKQRFGLEFRMMHTTFFLGRETLVPAGSGLVSVRQRLFQWMSLNSRSATSFFHLPPNRVVELGAQIEM